MALFALWSFLMIAAALPGLWPRALAMAEYPPDPWLILVVYLSMRGRGFTAVGWGIVLGFLLGAIPGIIIGLLMGWSRGLRALAREAVRATRRLGRRLPGRGPPAKIG